MKRVTGIGGIFFKSSDPKTLGAWYRDHLGLDVSDCGGGNKVELWEPTIGE